MRGRVRRPARDTPMCNNQGKITSVTIEELEKKMHRSDKALARAPQRIFSLFRQFNASWQETGLQNRTLASTTTPKGTSPWEDES